MDTALNPDFLQLFGLFALAVIAGLVDAMAGGGGLLTVPGLLATGLPPTMALGTNKAQGIFSSLSATLHFHRLGRIRLRNFWLPAVLAIVGGALGALLVLFISAEKLKLIIPFLLMAIGIYLLCSPTLGEVERQARMPQRAYAGVAGLIAAYDGMLGPGTGSFFALSGVALQGLKLDEATIRAKLYNLCSNLGSLCVFITSGKIAWPFAVAMACGMLLGGNIGARLIVRGGSRFIRPLLMVISFVMSFKLLWGQPFVQHWISP